MAEETKTTRRRAAPKPVQRAGNNIISIAPTEERKSTPTGYSTYTRMYKQHPIVRATIDKIAKTCVAAGYQFMPRDPAEEKSDDSRIQTLYETFARSRANFLLRQTYTDLLIYGDAYWWVTKSRLGAPYAFQRVAPSQVSIVVDKELGEVTSYIVRDAQGQETQFESDEFLHFKFFDPDNDVYGLSILESLQSTVAQDLFAQTYNEAFFANSAQTGIVFNMKNASKEEVERNREFLKKEYTSAANAHKPLLLEGDVEVSKSVATPAEMQFIEGRKTLTQEILAAFDLPYTKLGGAFESANRSQSAENDKSFRSETIVPLQSIIEEVINEQLVYIVFGFDDILFAHKDVDTRDEQAQMDLYVKGLSQGIYNLNYVQKMLGLPIAEGGDEPFIETPLGIMPVKMLGEAAEAILKQKTAPPPVPGGAGGTVPKGSGTPGGPQPKPKTARKPANE